MYIYICICITFFALTLCYTSFFFFLLYIVFIHVIVHVVTFGLKTSLHVLGEHNGTKTELYRTNAKSHGLVPAHFALIIIIVLHVVKYQSVLINTCRRQESLRMSI